MASSYYWSLVRLLPPRVSPPARHCRRITTGHVLHLIMSQTQSDLLPEYSPGNDWSICVSDVSPREPRAPPVRCGIPDRDCTYRELFRRCTALTGLNDYYCNGKWRCPHSWRTEF